MTRRRIARSWLLAVVVLCTGACAGRGGLAADASSASVTAATVTAATTGAGGSSATSGASVARTAQQAGGGGEAQSGLGGSPRSSGGGSGGGGGNPAGPGPDPNGGGSGGGAQEGTRPGAPYDIEAFENEGAPLDAFRDSYTSDLGCRTPPDERCHVVEEITGDDSDPTQCIVDSISYDPSSDPPTWPEGGPRPKIQEGTTVTAVVTCPDPSAAGSPSDSSASDSPATDTATESASASP